MAQITFVLPARDVDALNRTLSMLSFQKDRSFRAVIMDLAGSEAVHALVPDFEHHFPVTVQTVEQAGQPLWKSCLDIVPDAEWVCFLLPGVDLGQKSVARMNRCIDGHPSYDAFRWNIAEPARKWGLRTKSGRIFRHVFEEKSPAPLSAYVFRAQALREAFEADPEAAGMGLAVILSGAKKTGVRTVRWERVGFKAPARTTDPALLEKEVRARLAFFRWSERFFGDDYPLGVNDRLALFAGELARLYPSFTPEELKEDLGTFAVVNGPIRRIKAASALKTALKARQDSLKEGVSEEKDE